MPICAFLYLKRTLYGPFKYRKPCFFIVWYTFHNFIYKLQWDFWCLRIIASLILAFQNITRFLCLLFSKVKSFPYLPTLTYLLYVIGTTHIIFFGLIVETLILVEVHISSYQIQYLIPDATFYHANNLSKDPPENHKKRWKFFVCRHAI